MLDIEAYKERALADALSLAAAQDASTRHRAMVARIAAEILDFVDWNEARASDVLTTLHSCVLGPADAFGAIDALVDVVRRKESRQPAKVASALARAAEQAYARALLMSLHSLVVVMLDDDVWSAAVRTEWVESVVRFALGRRTGTRDMAGEVLHLYFLRHGVRHAWLDEIVREYPRLLRSPWLDSETKRAVHEWAPTVEGWLYLAELAPVVHLGRWDPVAFGPELPRAIESLEGAFTQTGSDGTTAKTVVLAAWLSQLLGPA